VLKLYAIVFFLLQTILFAKEYYAKVEPYEIRTVSSNVSGLVVFADEQKEGRVLGAKEYIVIDDALDGEELRRIEEKLASLKRTLRFNKRLLQNYREMLERKERNYEKIKGLKIKSSVEKDREFYDLVVTKNRMLDIEKESDALLRQQSDLLHRAALLKRTIADKHISDRGYVLYALHVKEHQFVSPGTPLAQIADISKAIVTIFVSKKEIADIARKTIYLDGKKSDYKVSRYSTIADTKHLSGYKVQIIVDAPKIFSKLMRVELKDE